MLTTRKSISILTSFIIAMIFISPVFANDSLTTQDWRGGPHIGLSLYTGIIGAEIQKGHYGATIGIPECIGFKYYTDERGYRWFFGIHAMHYSVDDDETVDNIPYDHSVVTDAGLGFGYRWRWWNHLDLTVSLSATYDIEKKTGPYATRTEKCLLPYPGITVGYTF